MLSSDVAVAKVVSATPTTDGQIEYAFLVQKRIAGIDREFFTLAVRKTRSRQEDNNFDSHHAEAFWQRGGGRLFNDTDCVIYPSFAVGDSYLTFLGQTITRRSFEKIATIDGQPDWNDRWLLYVQRRLVNSTANDLLIK